VTEAFRKLLLPGLSLDGAVWIEVEWTGARLSITGVVGPKSNGDCRGSCGQCRDALDGAQIRPAKGWSYGSIAQLQEVWNRWHLNDMRAGCEHQRELGWTYDEHPSEPCPTCGYKFGTAWRIEEVPEDVLVWLAALPETDKTYPWGEGRIR
jgi:hypothetical protein